MSGSEISWVQLLTLMVHAPSPEPTIRGAIRSFDGADETRGYVGWSAYAEAPRPVFAGVRGHIDESSAPAPVRVWRDGHRLRIEEPDGRPDLIVGDDMCWQFDRAHELPLESPADAVRYNLSGTELLGRREPDAFAGNDFTRPTGPVGSTTFLGRSAWTVELAPPSHKPYPIQLVVDAETGLVLQQRNDGFGSVDEWTEFVVGEVLDPALFHWDGPSRSYRDERAEREAEHEADTARRRAWFAANVCPLPIRVELELSVLLHTHDESGGFEASLGEQHMGMLARRPRSADAWDLGWSEIQHRRTDDTWDWALSMHSDPLSPGAFEALQRQLGSTPSG